jgi:acyl-[acyl-carrier-protein]-phospholipid O-acyltransferase/long-chain-fatty-acid--[acyl-carrier-protein] ligase
MTTNNPIKTGLRAFLHLVLRAVAGLLFRVRVQGLDAHTAAETKDRRLLVIVNHESFLDGILLSLFLPIRAPVFVVHTEVVKRPLWRLGLGLMADYLVVDPGNPDNSKICDRRSCTP